MLEIPDWETRLKTLKVVLSLLPKERKNKILEGLRLKDKDIAAQLKAAIVNTDLNGLRWGAHKKRFYILKRDKFTCRYCGQKAPKVILHVDHIIPISKGGTNENDNLITACRDCNLGKGKS